MILRSRNNVKHVKIISEESLFSFFFSFFLSQISIPRENRFTQEGLNFFLYFWLNYSSGFNNFWMKKILIIIIIIKIIQNEMNNKRIEETYIN
jgi:hypothetical protein